MRLVAVAGFAALEVLAVISLEPPKETSMPLGHFIYIIQENRSFDHYLGT